MLRNTKQMSPKIQCIYILADSIFSQNMVFLLEDGSCVSRGWCGWETNTLHPEFCAW